MKPNLSNSRWLALTAACLCSLCSALVSASEPAPASSSETALLKKAARIHREAIVIDGHNDVTSAMLNKGFQLGDRGDDPAGKIKTQTDLARLKAGGVGAQFFAIYVGPAFVKKGPASGGGAARRALDMIGVTLDQVQHNSNTIETAYTVADIRRISRKGKIAALMGIEGGHAIEDSLWALRMFHRLGVRYMTLTHVNSNDWADSEADWNDTTVQHHNGLTDFGRQVVREMNRLGMLVDISHVADKTFFDVIETTQVPVIASHSSARAVASHTRNMSDDMLRALAKNGGVVMVNFYDGFVDPKKTSLALRSRTVEKELTAKYPSDSQRVDDEMDQWWAANNPGKTPLSKLIDHIVHIATVAGIDHVGLGSDFDGAGGFPIGMEDVSQFPNITLELLRRGYSERDVKKILGENLLRVMAEAERFAARSR